MQSAHDPGVRLQADLRLRELARAGREPSTEAAPLPPPLEMLALSQPLHRQAPQPLNPAEARQVWLRLAVGMAFVGMLAVMAWLFVTGVAWNAMA